MTAAYEDLLTSSQLATVARVRSVCSSAGVAGAVVSMAANMLASDGTAVGLAVGVIAPAAFVVAAEIASAASSLPRTAGTRALLATLVALLGLVGISAAVVSFGHIREVVASVGESPTAEVLVAIVVDAVAVMGLIGHRLTGIYQRRHAAAASAKASADQAAAEAAAAEAERREAAQVERARRRADRQTKAKAATNGSVKRAKPVGDDPSLPPAERARALAAGNPEMTQAEIAEVIGRGERTVRRYLAEAQGVGDVEDQAADVEGQGVNEGAKQGQTDEGREAPGLVAA